MTTDIYQFTKFSNVNVTQNRLQIKLLFVASDLVCGRLNIEVYFKKYTFITVVLTILICCKGPTLKNESQQVPTQQYNQIANKMSQPAKSVSPQRLKKTETKQKTRIYNNTNLSSQNLVQIIQNTHPILQYNSGFHNASHHPMLGRGPLNNQLNHPLLNQRQNGTYSNR